MTVINYVYTPIIALVDEAARKKSPQKNILLAFLIALVFSLLFSSRRNFKRCFAVGKAVAAFFLAFLVYFCRKLQPPPPLSCARAFASKTPQIKATSLASLGASMRWLFPSVEDSVGRAEYGFFGIFGV